MKKIQSSLWTKLLAAVVLLACAFGTGVCGMMTMINLQYRLVDSWQSTYQFGDALEEYQNLVISAESDSIRLEELLSSAEEGAAGEWARTEIDALERRLADAEERLDPANTWFRFSLRTAEGEEFTTNCDTGVPLADQVKGVYRVVYQAEEDGYYFYETSDHNSWSVSPTDEMYLTETGEQRLLVLEYGVPEEIDESRPDRFWYAWQTHADNMADFNRNLALFLSLLAACVLALVCILWTSGHKRGVDGITTTWQEKIFFDLYAAAMIGAGVLLAASFFAVGENLYLQSVYHDYTVRAAFQTYETLVLTGLGTIFACFAAAVTLLLRTFAVRVKAGTLGRTTLIVRVVTWMVLTIHEFIRFLPFIWKAVLGFGVYVVFSFFCYLYGRYEGVWLFAWMAANVAVLLFLSWWAVGYHKLRQGTRTIVSGDLEYQIDTARMPHDLKAQAEDLNNISVGLADAVDEKMKSERFKAELITNVSHDLKTPLTSIINYVDLLKSTEQNDPKAVEYIEVLDRKSQRLKKLTEDLVEASKASTGVLSVNREKIGMAQLIDQAVGEWEEKLQARSLTLVRSLPEGETWVYADGRHLWRVIDNLLSNCAKYAMEGTRVYLDLNRGKGHVVLTVKNISREPLNVPPERLMERFVRGEESRSTEGSGLGLSIARSLTELQGGQFALSVDGDLFKAAVTLNQAN